MKFAIPLRLAVDADGYVWRIFDDEISGEMWSVATVNLDNEPIPEPVTIFEPVAKESPALLVSVAALARRYREIAARLYQRHEDIDVADMLVDIADDLRRALEATR